MKKYQSNIFRQAVAMLLMVWAVMCANVALAQTLTSENSIVDNSVSQTKITVSGMDATKLYGVFNASGNKVGYIISQTTSVDLWNIPLDEGDNTFSLFEVSDWQG
ncbi:MAG: hypothetical protein IIT32_06330, partial [Bacteroidales bacterium]|nr:hypothetical protein [Bacteroidales bacterium]